MISLRITSVAFMAAVIISGVDAYPIAQASDPNAGLAAPPTPDTGSSTPTVPATETATTGIVSPTLMPGTYLDTGSILAIVLGVLALFIITAISVVFAYRHTQTITKVALLKRRAKDKARIKASKHKTRRSVNSNNRPRNLRPVRDVEADLDAEDQPDAGRGRSRWSHSHEMANPPAAGSIVRPGVCITRDRQDSPTGLTDLREISPGASAHGENRNSRTVPIPRGTRSNSVSTTATSGNGFRNDRKLSHARRG
ncbi:hypothetical protein PgNI_05899 [Pyricularia grisea]|uniref:Transmembrane protein n=1 Tax=Pyricularia grisea TaxID=148305 RepID=A0A6P8B6N7_PYRGI|nr:hypothetical protein PgNI_05899 [Pyricularia grisea]TLD10928.1 hypothetical protein PgNI_05899 [Pyricularia grisea]